ncbi:MAG: dTDP-4-dehydrorhamnose reductase family protein [Gammaproteobacteria bacterium]
MSVKILILGGDGMLGHQLLEYFNSRYSVWVTLRSDTSKYRSYANFNSKNALFEVEASICEGFEKIIADIKPDVVINCVGIVRQRKEAEDAVESIKINSLLPHQLSVVCAKNNARLIHVSTDCVFSGKEGSYVESDIPDATDIYGRSKLLGEVTTGNSITLRTSIIGLELSRKQGLIEWFLAQRGTIKGYSNAIFTGFTTRELAFILEVLITQHPGLSGLWHVSSNPISKYQLLTDLAMKLNRKDIEIIEDKEFQCDRSLDGSKFTLATGYIPPSWDEMLDKLAAQIKNQKI